MPAPASRPPVESRQRQRRRTPFAALLRGPRLPEEPPMTRISDSGLSIAVVGATGQVGGAMLDILEERGFPVMALVSRLTAEEYFFVDKGWGTPEQKWKAFLELHETARRDLYGKGLEDCYCWLPSQIEKSFGRRLMRLGWEKNKWPSFTRRLEEPTTDLRQSCASTVSLSATS